MDWIFQNLMLSTPDGMTNYVVRHGLHWAPETVRLRQHVCSKEQT